MKRYFLWPCVEHPARVLPRQAEPASPGLRDPEKLSDTPGQDYARSYIAPQSAAESRWVFCHLNSPSKARHAAELPLLLAFSLHLQPEGTQ
mmetsp:Transcript_59892/g.140086  ORF Transcript_59892/g.140086 Transcript_59892/m.140086 type:complete len:91 (+) Transcript_59892:112-384(+)